MPNKYALFLMALGFSLLFMGHYFILMAITKNVWYLVPAAIVLLSGSIKFVDSLNMLWEHRK